MAKYLLLFLYFFLNNSFSANKTDISLAQYISDNKTDIILQSCFLILSRDGQASDKIFNTAYDIELKQSDYLSPESLKSIDTIIIGYGLAIEDIKGKDNAKEYCKSKF